MVDGPGKGELFKADVTCLKGDSLSMLIEAGETFTICDEFDRYKNKTFEAGTYKALTLQKKVYENGKRCGQQYSLMEKKDFYNRTLMHFSPSERRLINPHYYKVDISDDLYNLKISIIERLAREIKVFRI